MLDHTHTHGQFRLRYGHPLPFGASHVPGGVNFSIFSANATSCTLVLFEKESPLPFAEIPFPPEYRLGNVWAMTVFDLNYEQVEYGYRFDGLHDPHQGHHFDPEKILLDPDAMEISGRDVWKQSSKNATRAQLKSREHERAEKTRAATKTRATDGDGLRVGEKAGCYEGSRDRWGRTTRLSE
jgi:pullulanase/glycogen debranching enzyme